MRVFPFQHPTLPSSGYSCVPMNTNLVNILWFSCQGKSRDIVYQRTCCFSWLIFVQYGLFGILLNVYSALSRLTDHGIYYITQCGIWLLTIFHILYVHFQQELRKVTPQKLYLSFFVQYISDLPLLNTIILILTKLDRNLKSNHTVLTTICTHWCLCVINANFRVVFY